MFRNSPKKEEDMSVKELKDEGNIFLEAGKFEEALGFFDKAILLNQNDPELWKRKGVTLRSMGKHNEANDCFNKSFTLDPRNKKVSPFWQCGMVLIVPLGLWAFYRIKKLRYGILLYILTIGLRIGLPIGIASLGYGLEYEYAYSLASIGGIVGWLVAIVIVMGFIGKWSEDWNKKIDMKNS